MGLLAKRIPTVVAILVLVLGIAGGIWMVNKQKPKINEVQVKPKSIRITNLSDNKFTVSWTTDEAVEAKIIYGKVGEKLKLTATDDRDLGETAEKYKTHYITISKLQPNTQYAFKLVEGKAEFDNNGSPYAVKTAPTLSTTPTAETIYGVIKENKTIPAKGAIVYVDIPGATPLSTLVRGSGNWSLPISVARTLDLNKYIKYDPDATIFKLTATDGTKEATAKVALKFAKPVPDIELGQSYEFLAQASPEPSQQQEATESAEASPSGQVAETPKIFNIEPLSGESASQSATATKVEVIYPEEGEVVTSNKPEFRGTGPKGTTLSLSLLADGGQSLSDTVAVDEDGTWTWTPTEKLNDDSYVLAIEYIGEDGQEEKVERNFSIGTDGDSGQEPAFEASESSKRATMPSTESGVPVTGVVEQTWLTLLAGFAIMVLGFSLLGIRNEE